jgi:membrane protease YdiL (CAAX protease family)
VFWAVLGYIVTLAAAYGLAYWAYRARVDRSAYVGLFLLFGFPAFLLALAGLALLTSGSRLGGLLLAVGLGLGLPLLSPVRRLVASVTPMDCGSPVDMTGLCLLLAVIGFLGYDAVVSPEPPDDVPSVGVAELVAQTAILVSLAYVTVGWRIARDLQGATHRLGIRRPTWSTVPIAVGFLLLAYLVYGIVGAVTQAVQPDVLDKLDDVTDDLTAGVQNPAGAALLGASAGIGEEAVFRGALQPRYGIALTSVAFALLHAPQYGFSLIILGLFLVGVVLGIERQYFGTTASMTTHALYNFIAVLVNVYS